MRPHRPHTPFSPPGTPNAIAWHAPAGRPSPSWSDNYNLDVSLCAKCSGGYVCSLCANHTIEWRKAREAGGNLVDFMRTTEPLTPTSWYQPEDCTICPGIPAWASNPLRHRPPSLTDQQAAAGSAGTHRM
ncbi:hypothetical protein AB0H23_27350 [Streptomyces albogriseolus]|uniref:hypothetical protein n=1 Tax=Streptomyces albogriseolus TaxID=1887 RepID=UPI00345FDAE2